ncbi:MAG: NAD(P)-dependent glycerol-3-phosphate dehydrogenase [Peptoniphilaceae bacterium]|nr:NAD(P)-dependent glycerol-3-phosphate dehydrogenase [Peptoniphilaceae bacterium]MDY6019582.1 NAD(P)H-dependent glycerol-3-phosphate dehydrogenase [Anaerococcus sp.]
MEISILGAGSWASAIANLLADKNDILIYARNIDDVNNINNYHINKKYFPDKKLPANIRATNNIEELFDNKYVINAIPTQAVRSVLLKAKDFINNNHIIINLSKGLELKTHMRISEIFKDLNINSTYAILSGPSHAEEVIQKMPTAVVCACLDTRIAKNIQDIFMRDYFRVYTSDDVVGVELGGAIKNVLAFCIGMATGLNYGDNAKAAIMTRGIHEMSNFALIQGANIKTINGLAGIGDLIVTATSMHSRNNRAGILVGKGYSVEDACNKIHMVVEGIPTTESIYELANNLDIELPITNELYKVLYQGKNPKESVMDLMNRDRKSEY